MPISELNDDVRETIVPKRSPFSKSVAVTGHVAYKSTESSNL